MNLITKIFRSFVNAFKGLKYAYQDDKSFQLEVFGSVILIFVGYIFWPLETTELLFLILSYLLILTTELINTAIEKAFEKLHPGHDELVGASKDIASSAVLMAFIFTAVVIVSIIINHI